MVIAPERIYSDPAKGPQYVIAYEGQPVKRSVLEALGYAAPKPAAVKKRGAAAVENKAVKPDAKTAE